MVGLIELVVCVNWTSQALWSKDASTIIEDYSDYRVDLPQAFHSAKVSITFRSNLSLHWTHSQAIRSPNSVFFYKLEVPQMVISLFASKKSWCQVTTDLKLEHISSPIASQVHSKPAHHQSLPRLTTQSPWSYAITCGTVQIYIHFL